MIEQERLDCMRKAFADRFGSADRLVLSRAPGRVNLIGEHTDYNGGYVLPMAVERDIVVLGASSPGGRIRLHSLDFDDSVAFDPDDVEFDTERAWVNYPKGVMKFLGEAGVSVKPFDAVIGGNVPIGGGLSSSAAFEVAMTRFLLALAGVTLDGVAVAKLARRAENEFVGVQCGIMDPFVSVFAERGHALFIDCKTLEHRVQPLFGDACEFVVVNSTVKHALGETAYHTRQAECREGLSTLVTVLGERETLRDVDERDYRAARQTMRPEVRRRLDHVFGENRRVLEALAAMQRHDATRFGELMNASHDSLRDDYEVSCRELDVLVDAARRVEGVLGSRMTGGGFGGCTVSLVETRAADRFVETVGGAYEKETGLRAEFIRTGAAQGATVQTLPSPGDRS
ncbi:MAG TPA: galactokinase [Planctomycetota bacterium]|nr:galactokinase [Planctomycetota bacterium]